MNGLIKKLVELCIESEVSFEVLCSTYHEVEQVRSLVINSQYRKLYFLVDEIREKVQYTICHNDEEHYFAEVTEREFYIIINNLNQ